MTKKIRKTGSKAKVTIGFEGDRFDADGVPASYRESIELQVDRIGAREMRKAQVDAEIIASLFRKHPKEITAMVNHMISGRRVTAREIASRIGLTEETFQKEGGGYWWWLILAVGGVIYGYAATHKP